MANKRIGHINGEYLLVVTLIGMLVGLIIPAVQVARQRIIEGEATLSSIGFASLYVVIGFCAVVGAVVIFAVAIEFFASFFNNMRKMIKRRRFK